METGPEPLPAPSASTLPSLAAQTRAFLHNAKAPATRRAYRSDWKHFEDWCSGKSLPSLPASPQTVALYLTDLAARFHPSTLRRRLTVISRAHAAAALPSPATMQEPLVSETLKGIRRTVGTAQTAKRPLFTEQLRAIIRALPDTLQGLRDRAILLVGFAGGFRRWGHYPELVCPIYLRVFPRITVIPGRTDRDILGSD